MSEWRASNGRIHKSGEIVIACRGADHIGNCATCMYDRDWTNSRLIHEGEDGYCDCPDVVTEKGSVIEWH